MQSQPTDVACAISNFYLRIFFRSRQMEGPQTAEWGPALWGILHMLAEKSGRGSGIVRYMGRGPLQLCHAEQRRIWAALFVSLRTSLPCPLCKQHYVEYIRLNPPDAFLRIPGPDWAVGLRQWIWAFHNAVRTRKEQPLLVTQDQLATLYVPSAVQFQSWKQIVQEHMRRGMFLRWLVREDMLRTVQALEQLWILSA
jgi:hypothetical protein